jgi:nickel/cobalt exporter
VSYFLSREARLGRGLLMGAQIAIFHVLSAIVIVLAADFLLRQAFGAAPAEVPGIRLLSYGLIALIGLVMLAQALRRSWLRRQGIAVAPPSCCGHDHAGGHDHGQDHGQGRVEQGTLSLGVGLVPCTGSVLILLYAVANDILPAGLILVAAIATGMAITMGGLGVLTVVARQAVAARVEGGDGNGRLALITDYAGALAITLLGCGLFWISL